MANSTEDQLRANIVTAIETIATTELGFDNALGNVKDYFPEFHETEDIPGYFMADVSSRKRARVWAVQVLSEENLFVDPNNPMSCGIAQRNYNVTIRGYYERGKGGTGINEAITDARKVRETLRGLVAFLGGQIDTIEDPETMDVSEDTQQDLPNIDLVVVELAFSGTCDSPAY